MLRLFADVSEHYQIQLPPMLSIALRDPRVDPVVAVRSIHGMWSLGGVELSEEIYEALAKFSGIRHGEIH